VYWKNKPNLFLKLEESFNKSIFITVSKHRMVIRRQVEESWTRKNFKQNFSLGASDEK